jgi:hypothetical protein
MNELHLFDAPDRHAVRIRYGDSEPFVIDNVPTDSTVSAFLSKLLSIDSLPQNAGDSFLRGPAGIMPRDSLLGDEEYELIFERRTPSSSKTIFFFVFFLMTHMIPAFFVLFHHAPRLAIESYILGLFLLVGACHVGKPRGQVFKDITTIKLNEIFVLDFLVLLCKSFLPTFRLEDVLIHD